MTALSTHNSIVLLQQAHTLEEYLDALAQCGKPNLFHGWSAHVTMNTNLAGAAFEIRSDFRMGSPLEAVQQCAERVITALSKP